MGVEQWVTDHNGVLTIFGTLLGVADPMIATWLDNRRSIQRGLVLGIAAFALSSLVVMSDIDISLRIGSIVVLLSGFMLLVGIKVERWRRGEKAPVPCEVLLDRQAQKEARLDELRHASHSFDLMAVSGLNLLQDFEPDLRTKIAQGVKIRVLLLDPDGPHLPVVAQATAHEPEALRQQIKTAQTLLSRLKTIASRSGRGDCVEYRLFDRLPFYSFWIADKSTVNVQVFSYCGPANYRAFRGSNKAIMLSMQKEFDRLWDPNKEELLT